MRCTGSARSPKTPRAFDTAPDPEGLVEVDRDVVKGYDPKREAVVIESRHEAVDVVVVREAAVVTFGTLDFVDPT
jgi:hypothetical protein